MSWLIPHCSSADTSARLDAALAQTRHAQHETKAAARSVVEVTDDTRERLTAIRRQIRRRTDILEEKTANKPVHTSEVRSLVEELLARADERTIERARREH